MRYFLALDRFNADAVRTTLPDPFTIDTGGVVAGPVAAQPLDDFMAELVRRSWGFLATAHLNPNSLTELEGDRRRIMAARHHGDDPGRHARQYR